MKFEQGKKKTGGIKKGDKQQQSISVNSSGQRRKK